MWPIGRAAIRRGGGRAGSGVVCAASMVRAGFGVRSRGGVRGGKLRRLFDDRRSDIPGHEPRGRRRVPPPNPLPAISSAARSHRVHPPSTSVALPASRVLGLSAHVPRGRGRSLPQTPSPQFRARCESSRSDFEAPHSRFGPVSHPSRWDDDPPLPSRERSAAPRPGEGAQHGILPQHPSPPALPGPLPQGGVSPFWAGVSGLFQLFPPPGPQFVERA